MRNLIVPMAAATAAMLLSSCTMTPAEIARADEARAATQAALGRELAGLRPVRTQACIDRFQQTGLKAYGGTLVYAVSDKLKYVNDTTGGCENVERGDILVTKSPSGQLCRGDIGTTVQPTSQTFSGSCSMGSFTVYRK